MRKRIISLVLALLLFVGLFPVAANAASLTYSDALVNYIKYGEGFSPTLYQDTGGWCIGYGCLVNPDDYPNGITEPEAEALLREKMDLLANEVKRFLNSYGVSVTQGQFDAMCSMTYNLGGYWLSAANTLPKMIINGAWNYSAEDIVSAFAAWCHVGVLLNCDRDFFFFWCVSLSCFNGASSTASSSAHGTWTTSCPTNASSASGSTPNAR